MTLTVALNLNLNKQSQDPDQSAQPRSLIKDFTVHLQKYWVMYRFTCIYQSPLSASLVDLNLYCYIMRRNQAEKYTKNSFLIFCNKYFTIDR